MVKLRDGAVLLACDVGKKSKIRTDGGEGWGVVMAIASLISVFNRYEFQILGANVVGARPDDLVIDALLDHVRAQPLVREMTNSGVNIAVGTPIM